MKLVSGLLPSSYIYICIIKYFSNTYLIFVLDQGFVRGNNNWEPGNSQILYELDEKWISKVEKNQIILRICFNFCQFKADKFGFRWTIK